MGHAPIFARILGCFAVFAVALSTNLAAGDDAHAAPAARPGEYYGMNIQALISRMPPSTWAAQLDGVAASGIDVVRFDAVWNAVEPRAPVGGVHRYHWTRYDPIVAELAKRGLRWAPIVDYSAGWAASQPGQLRSPPRDLGAFAAYAGALAARYGRNGAFWREHPELPQVAVTDYEIWNAPNHTTTLFPVNAYADAYLGARTAIRSVDPEGRAWVGGLGRGAPTFVRSMLEHRPDARGNIDAVGLHPYGNEPARVFGWIAELRHAMDALGLVDVPIAITEVGWSTGGQQPAPYATEVARARYYKTLADVLVRSDCGVNVLMPHTWVTPEQDPADAEHWFGIQRPDGAPTSTSAAYAEAVRRGERWLAGARRAEVAVCGRAPVVRIVRKRVRPGRRARARTCVAASVRLGRARLRGASVRFRYRGARGVRRRSRALVTDARGSATDCPPASRRRGRGKRQVSVSATRADLATTGSAKRVVRLP